MNKTINQIVEEVQNLVSEYSFVEERDGAPYISHENGYSDALTNYFTNLLQSKEETEKISTTPVGLERTNKYGDQMYFTGKKRIPFKGEWYMDDQDMVIQCNHFMDTAYEIYSFEKP